MELNMFDYYLIIANIVGFILFAINTWLYTYTQEGQIDKGLTITALLGGSLGIIVSILLIDRKAQKGNMMSRVFVACVFVIQIVIFLISKGFWGESITINFWKFFGEHIMLLWYFVIINFITFAAFAYDKIAAIEHRSRIRIVTLLALAFMGGSIGGLGAMYLYRHKTRQDYFTVGIPLIMIMQIVVIFYFMNVI